MIFETLHRSAQRGELILIDGGFCHWHLRRDGHKKGFVLEGAETTKTGREVNRWRLNP